MEDIVAVAEILMLLGDKVVEIHKRDKEIRKLESKCLDLEALVRSLEESRNGR